MSFWAVAQVCSQQPCQLGGQVKSRVELRLAEAGFETYQPWTKIRMPQGTKIAALFPGYIFVRVVEQWWSIRWTPGVIKVLKSSNNKPYQLADCVVDDLRRNEIGGLVRLPSPPDWIAKGQQVRVLTGQFRNHLGLYEGQSSRGRNIVLLSLLGRWVPAELGKADRVEAV